MFKKIPTLLFSLLLFASSSFAGDRDVIREEKNLENVNKQIRETETLLANISKKEFSLLEEMGKVNKELKKRKNDLRKVQRELIRVNTSVIEKRRTVEKLKYEKEKTSKYLEKRLKAMYKMRGGLAYMTLLGSDSISDFQRSNTYLTKILDKDREVISQLEGSIANLKAEESSLLSLKNDLKKKKADRERKRVSAQSKANVKKKVLRKIKGDKKHYKKMTKELKTAQKMLSKLIEGLRGSSSKGYKGTGFSAMRGLLKMPVKGKIISKYGKVKHREFKTVTFNNGIEIKAKYGTLVKSVYGGTVAYTGWLRGYGDVMIVDNGGGYYTLFAYLSEMLKSKGDEVVQGDEIARVGDKGVGDEPALYFEIREKGSPKDPEPWLSKN